MAFSPSLDKNPSSASTARRLAGATGIMMAAILVSRLLGLARDAVIAGKFGQGFDTDIYNAAFMIPDLLFFLIAGGALSSAFIPVFTEKITTGQEKEAWHVFSTVACVMAVVVSGFVLIGEIFAAPLVRLLNSGFSDAQIDATVPLTRIVLPAQICFFLGGVLMGTQNARQMFFIPALGPIIYNIGIIGGGLFLGSVFGVAGLCWGALLGAIAGNFALQLWAVARSGMRFQVSFDWKHPDVMKIWRLMLPVVFGLALPQVSIIINRMFATYLGEGQLSAISNANRLMQVPLGIFAQAMGVAIFPTLSAQAAQKRFEELRATASLGIRSILFLTIPSSLFMIVLARPIVALLLQHGRFTASDTDITATALIFYSIGIFAWSAQSILSRSFYAMQDTITPVVIGSAVTLIFVPMNWLFMKPWGLGYVGLCLATTIAATLHAIIMTLVLRRRLGGIEGGRMAVSVGKTLLASLLATAACWAAFRLFEGLSPAGTAGVKVHALLTLLVGLAVGGAVYVLSAILLRIEEMQRVTDILQRRRLAGQ